MFQRAAPIFAVRDVAAALRFYARLGFEVRRYKSGEYGFATRDGVEIHLGHVADSDRQRASAYAYVDDADGVAAEWRVKGAEVHGPQDTAWGQREGADRPRWQRHPVRFAIGLPGDFGEHARLRRAGGLLPERPTGVMQV